MNKDHHTFWGVILLGAGIIFLLRNYGWLPVDWQVLYRLWPFVFIFWGIAALEVREPTKRFLFLLALIALIALLTLAEPVSMPMMRGRMYGGYWW